MRRKGEVPKNRIGSGLWQSKANAWLATVLNALFTTWQGENWLKLIGCRCLRDQGSAFWFHLLHSHSMVRTKSGYNNCLREFSNKVSSLQWFSKYYFGISWKEKHNWGSFQDDRWVKRTFNSELCAPTLRIQKTKSFSMDKRIFYKIFNSFTINTGLGSQYQKGGLR